MFTDSDKQTEWVQEQLRKGRSFIKIAEEMALPGKYGMDHLNEVLRIAQFMPSFIPEMMGSYIHTDDLAIRIAYRFPCPQILLLDNVLTDEECDEIIARSLPYLKPSKVHTEDGGKKSVLNENRRSDTYYLHRGKDEFVQRIDHRCSQIMRSPVINGESLQVVRYKPGGEYRPHYDFGKEPDGNMRCATLLIYLNDVQEGGKTYFPGLGLNVTPKKGSAVYFHYMDAHGRADRMDPQTLHGGEPVISGEKWIVTKWARQRPYILKSSKA